ncbi:MAG TPA: M28 family metallopeptidase [Allosphingosinicella sp.]|nr:M28 family metallopeptidase [Allosphingosinicella sp.]
MRFIHFAGVATMALLAGSAPAQQAAAPEFSADRVRAHVAFLSDDLLEGRDAGTRGYDIAARYVATQFEALGLEPAGPGGAWYQNVPFRQNRFGQANARLAIAGTTFENGKDIIIAPGGPEPRQAIEASVVFVGYGLQAPELGIDDYKGLDVRGKVVAMLSGFPKGMASDIGAHLASQKAKVAQANGAVGTLNILTPTALKVFSWERRAAYAAVPTLNWLTADGRPYSDSPDLKFGAALNAPAAEALFRGARRPLAAILAEAEREGGKPKGFALAQTMRFERESVGTRFDSPNVVAVLPGSDPVLKDEYVLVMGHLDHDGVDESLPGKDKIYNGALDNAAGIATLLEAARALAASPDRARRSILFAAVTAEEDGLLGAQYLARNPLPGRKLVGVVNLDMPILTYDFEDVIAFGAEHSTLGPIVERAAARDRVTLTPDPYPEQGLFTRSDHYEFVKVGIPSVALATGIKGPGKDATAAFLANHYHRVSDQMDLPIRWDAAAKFARINYLIAREIADAPEAPRWYADSFFGKVFAPRQKKAAR